MRLPRRRLVLFASLGVLILLTIPAIWLGVKWNRALSNINKMIVPTVVLPTTAPATPEPLAVAETPDPEVPPLPEPTAVPPPDGVQNILLVGTDARIGEDVSRTDTMVWVHLDPQANRVSMMSFPRDLWVNIPGYGKNRINTAYLTGETKLGKGYGPALLKKTVGDLVGVPIDHFVLINFDGFKTIIDKIGGIYVDVPKVIDDAKYPMDEYAGDVRTMKIHFDAGRQLMDGSNALIYARTRHADSDFGRNQRQQQVLMAIFDRMREQGLLGQLTSLDDYTDVLSNYIRTDLSRTDMLGLAGMGSRLHSENIQRFAIDAKMVTPQTTPAYVLLLKDQKALRLLVNQMLDPSAAAAGGENPAP